MNKTKSVILVIEDDPQIRRVLSNTLEAYGYELHCAVNGAEGKKLAVQHQPDLIILDLGLPDTDGLGMIRELRTRPMQEILVLSARGAEDIKVRALDLGADDYLTKPFGVYELMARVRVALRRAHHAFVADESIEIGSIGVTIEVARHRVLRGGVEIHLTPIEFRLIVALARHGGKILTHEQLLSEVWGPGHEESTQYLRIYLGGLRKKLEPNPAQPRALITVPGVGYSLAVQVAAGE
jgi:two-component system KDP operon response regulator KdpE